MSVTMPPPKVANMTELTGLLEGVHRLAEAAGRPDLGQWLDATRAGVAGRAVRIVVVGTVGQGVTSLVDVLSRTPAQQLPGAIFADTPCGVGDATRAGSAPLSVPVLGSGDAVVFVSDAAREYTPAEVKLLAGIRARGTAVVAAITKIDLYPGWSDIQAANRRRLQAAGPDVADIPLLPVSALLSEAGRRQGDVGMRVASGLPQLIDFLREHVLTTVGVVFSESVIEQIRAISDQLAMGWNAELDTLGSTATGGGVAAQQRWAVAEAERLRQQSANWQLALSDGATELMVRIEHDLRHRLREVVRLAEQDIATSDPVPRWEQFNSWLREQVEEGVRANFGLAQSQSRMLAQRVSMQLPGSPNSMSGTNATVAFPEPRVDQPGDVLQQVGPLPELDSRKAGLGQRVISSVRGSYGGILMVGVLTSLLGMALVNWWSIGAGVLLGANTFWEDRKSRVERRKVEAKMAVSRLMDEVIFQVGNESRARLRGVHRMLRDQFTVVADQRLRHADNALRAASEAGQQDARHRDQRLGEVQNNLAELRQLRVRISTLTRAPDTGRPTPSIRPHKPAPAGHTAG